MIDLNKQPVSIDMSVCSKFLFIGYDKGLILKLNIDKAKINKDFLFINSLTEEIKGVFTDSSNHKLVILQNN